MRNAVGQRTSHRKYSHAANSLLATINFNLEDIRNWAILDSGATSHFLVPDAPTINVQPALNPLHVTMPDGNSVSSTHTCELDLPQLPKQARLGHIIPGLSKHSLLSVIKLCNAGCQVELKDIGATVKYRGKIVLQGKKCTNNHLWFVKLVNDSTENAKEKSGGPILIQEQHPQSANAIAHKPAQPNWPPHKMPNPTSYPTYPPTCPLPNMVPHHGAFSMIPTSSHAQLAMFYHQSVGSPPASTFVKAIRNGQFKSFPGLTAELITKHLPPSKATAKGHMVRKRQGVQSTRSQRKEILDARLELADMNPPQEACAANENEMFCFAALADANEGVIYSDQTGRFPVMSHEGMQYLFIAYIYDENAILIRPLRNREDSSMVECFKDVYSYLEARGCKPKLHVLDNECSRAIKQQIKTEGAKIQLVEPHNHRVNAAEPAVKTAKYHFIASLATVSPNCPLQIWCQFLPQVEMTLNMLRTSRRDPSKSAHDALEGDFDFNRTPLAPLGTPAVVYDDPSVRGSWAPHGTDAFYVGPCIDHYRLQRFFIPSTRRYRDTGTRELYPAHCNVPTISEADRTLLAAQDLLQAARVTIPNSAAQKLSHIAAIQKLTEILDKTQQPRVAGTRPPRVARAAPPRVTPAQEHSTNPTHSTAANPTDPKIVRAAPRIHGRRTRRNAPMPPIPEEQPTKQPVPAPAAKPGAKPQSRRPTPPQRVQPTRGAKLRKSHGELIGAKKNDAARASRRRVRDLVRAQLERDQHNPPPTAARARSPTSPAGPFGVRYIVPTPKRSAPTPHPITQEESAATAATEPPQDRTYSIDSTDRPVLQRTCAPARVTPAALQSYLGEALLNGTHQYVPRRLISTWEPLLPPTDIEEVANGVVHPVTKETITKYHKLIEEPLLREVWMKAMCIELGRLAQGYKDTEGTNTIKFLNHDEIATIPGDRTITYARIVVDYRPQKADPNRVRITVGGNLIDYPYELTTRTADLTTTKVMWNSVISTPGARYICADAKNFYLNTPLDRYEYMKMPIKLIPQEFIDLYDLASKAKNGYVYMEIQRGMYGLPQSGILANKLLKERLAKHGYNELPHTPGLFKHDTRPVWFTLVVDDFGIKYIGEEHAKHLLDILREHYTMDVDLEGKLYCGISLEWNYEDKYVDLSMRNYVQKQLDRYGWKKPKRPQHCPYEPAPVKYGAKSDEIIHEKELPLLDKEEKKFIQRVIGSFLYYARAIDMTILTALNAIASDQAKPTKRTMQRVHQFLDYMATHPTAVIRFRASDMILNVHSDASYLSAGKARSRAGGYFFLGSLPKNKHPIRLNGNVQITCSILKLVAASAAEAELGALFLNAREAKILRLTLHELGHSQPPTPIHVDNTTAVGIVNNTIKRQRSRAMEMRYFWLLDQYAQKNFDFQHHPGQENLADYPSKHHTGKGHQHVRPYYLHTEESPLYLPRAVAPSTRRGCAEILGDPYHKLVPLPRLQSRAQGYTPSIPSKGIVDTPAVATAACAIQFLRRRHAGQCRRRTGQCQRTLTTDAQRYMYLLNHFTPKILTN